MTFHSDVHHRRSIRLPDYDYSAGGAYFVTICTHDRAPLFGKIIDGTVILNETGGIVREEWLRTASMRQRVELDAFVVMPNHFHAILRINTPAADYAESNPRRGALHAPYSDAIRKSGARSAPLHRQCDSLASILGGFKSAVTRRVNAKCAETPVWQRNYYEHVIRNPDDLASIRDYIAANPSQWETDEYRCRGALHAPCFDEILVIGRTQCAPTPYKIVTPREGHLLDQNPKGAAKGVAPIACAGGADSLERADVRYHPHPIEC